jgi:hypothetical protein
MKREADNGAELRQAKKRRSRWGEKPEPSDIPPLAVLGKQPMLPGNCGLQLLTLYQIYNESISSKLNPTKLFIIFLLLFNYKF